MILPLSTKKDYGLREVALLEIAAKLSGANGDIETVQKTYVYLADFLSGHVQFMEQLSKREAELQRREERAAQLIRDYEVKLSRDSNFGPHNPKVAKWTKDFRAAMSERLGSEYWDKLAEIADLLVSQWEIEDARSSRELADLAFRFIADFRRE